MFLSSYLDPPRGGYQQQVQLNPVIRPGKSGTSA